MSCFEDILLEVKPDIDEDINLDEYAEMEIPETKSLASNTTKTIDNIANSVVAAGQNFNEEDMTIASTDIKSSTITVQRENVLPSDTGVTQSNEPDTSSPSMDEDYPQSETIYVDEKGTWIKNNKAKGSLDIVHQSGSSLHFKKDGTVILFARKDLKQVVDGDYTLEVGNNFDISVGKDARIHTLGSMDMSFDTSWNVLSPLTSQISVSSYIQTNLVQVGSTNVLGSLNRFGSESISGSMNLGGDANIGGTMSASSCDC